MDTNAGYRHTIVALSGFIIAASIIISCTTSSYADNINPSLFPVDSKPYGKTYGEWSSKWVQWLLSTPIDTNPSNDDTGKNCAVNQTDPNVWFLAGTGSGSAVRTCSIPAGKAIFFPILNTECSFLESPKFKTESELRSCATDANKGAVVHATIDGVELKDLEMYHIVSALFDLRLADNNIYGTSGGATKSVTDGYWVFVEPLPSGKHELHFSGSVIDNPTLGTQSYATEATYHLTVR